MEIKNKKKKLQSCLTFYTEGGTLCVKLREEHRLRALENRVLSRAVGLKKGRSNRGVEKIAK